MTRKTILLLAFALTISLSAAAQNKRAWIPYEEFFAVRDTVSIVLVGDVMMHGPQFRDAHRQYAATHAKANPDNPNHYDFSTFFKYLEGRISNADLAIANMEFPLAGTPYSGYPAFSAPDSYPDYVVSCGFDVLLTANNHILDRGSAGLRRTIRVYDNIESETHVVYTGVSKSASDDEARYPVIVTVKGVRIAIVNFTYGTNSGGDSAWPKVNLMRKDDVAKAIARAKEQEADVIIAIPHWGVEYQHRHNAIQGEFARWMARQGVDAVIGHHPHVVQDFEVIPVEQQDGSVKEVPVLYSLGNAVSNQNDLPARLEGLAELRIATKGREVHVLPDPSVTFLWCTKPGMVEKSYSVLPVKEFLDKKDSWRNKEDYDNMVATYKSVKAKTGIED